MIFYGFLFPLIEDSAKAIGAGILVGTFLGATRGVIEGRSRRSVEATSLRDGYAGALVALLAAFAEGRNV